MEIKRSLTHVPFAVIGSEIAAGNILGGRLRRQAVIGTEVDNEIIVLDCVVEYMIDKLYGTW